MTQLRGRKRETDTLWKKFAGARCSESERDGGKIEKTSTRVGHRSHGEGGSGIRQRDLDFGSLRETPSDDWLAGGHVINGVDQGRERERRTALRYDGKA